MNVLGLDPGSRVCGYAVVGDGRRDGGVVEMGILKLTKKAPLFVRLAELVSDIDELIRDLSIEGVCLENVFVHPKRPQAVIPLAQARGAILGYIASRDVFSLLSGNALASGVLNASTRTLARSGSVHHVELIEPAPKAVKKWLTGNGNASKEQMQLAIQRECGMKKPPEPHDVADAIGLAKYGRHQILLNRAVTA